MGARIRGGGPAYLEPQGSHKLQAADTSCFLPWSLVQLGRNPQKMNKNRGIVVKFIELQPQE